MPPPSIISVKTMSSIYAAADLISFATALFNAAGLSGDRARTVGTLLVEADLLGHNTHGLQLAGTYLDAATKGTMSVTGDPDVLADRGAVVTWDGRRLPGVWLTAAALDLGIERAKTYGSATVVVRRSHHIACLAAYLQKATEQGCMAIIASSDPSEHSVAPFGGRRSLFTPDPIAIGIPTDADPILVDISASITTNGMTARLKKAGERFPGRWVMDADGNPSDDPSVVLADPPGTILPIGGIEYGHKGYGLALMIEALTQGLGGYGRADGETGWGASFFVQVFDPEAFGGQKAFTRQTSWIAEACRTTPPRPGGDPVRLPGERALQRKRQALDQGLELHAGIMEELTSWADKLGIAPPCPI
ncbi:MAG: Ldh family oxidoreductase [Geminicoccaceae bacterium]